MNHFHGVSDQRSAAISGVKIGEIAINREMDVLRVSPLAAEIMSETCTLQVISGKVSSEFDSAIGAIKDSISILDNTHRKTLILNPEDLGLRKEDSLVVVVQKDNDGTCSTYSIIVIYLTEEVFYSEFMAEVCRISVAERKIISAIIRHDNLKNVSRELGVSINTVKAQLKSIYKKVGVSSKGMLIKKMYVMKSVGEILQKDC